MSNKQSSVEWYDNEIGKLFNQFTVDKITIYEFRTEQLKLKQQARAMHKEEILYAIEWGNRKGYDEHKLTCIHDEDEQYYNETFNQETK